jgi:hypothetical protein
MECGLDSFGLGWVPFCVVLCNFSRWTQLNDGSSQLLLGYRPDGQGSARVKDFSFLHDDQTGSGTHQHSYPLKFSPWVKVAGA